MQSQKLPFQQEMCFILQYNTFLMTDNQLWPQTQAVTYFFPQFFQHTEASRNTTAPCAPPSFELERDFGSHRMQVSMVAEGRPLLHCEQRILLGFWHNAHFRTKINLRGGWHEGDLDDTIPEEQ